MHHVGLNHLKESVVVSDDNATSVGSGELIDTLRHDTHGIHVETRVGFVEDGEFGFEHSHLEYLVAFFLTA